MLCDCVCVSAVEVLLGILRVLGCGCASPSRICVGLYQVFEDTTDLGLLKATFLKV